MFHSLCPRICTVFSVTWSYFMVAWSNGFENRRFLLSYFGYVLGYNGAPTGTVGVSNRMRALICCIYILIKRECLLVILHTTRVTADAQMKPVKKSDFLI